MYRTRNGGDSWEKIEKGLPSRFGFPIARDPSTGTLFAAPVESDEYRMFAKGELRVYRSRDGGGSWEPASKPLSKSPVYALVLRTAMSVDGLEPGGVYFGTTAGTVHASRDCGKSWGTLPVTLPRILCVSAFKA